MKRNVELDLVYAVSPAGHRQAYLDLFSPLFGLRPIAGPIGFRLWIKMVKVPRLLFATIDDSYFIFILVAITRSLLGRRTAGLFLRPNQCFEPRKFVHRLKKWGFIAARRLLPSVSLFTILPFSFEPRFEKVARSWVHDPQMWDMHNGSGIIEPPKSDLSQLIKSTAGTRSVLCYVGGGKIDKGFAFLGAILSKYPSISERVLVVCAGRVDVQCRNSAEKIVSAGGMCLDRFVTDDELGSLYGVADYVWCCYDPSYDQASGIFGRCIQFGVTPLIRTGSLLERYTDENGVQPIRLTYGDVDMASAQIMNLPERAGKAARPQELIGAWRTDFIQKISAAL